MDPMLIVQGVLAAVAAAPKIEALAISAKDFIKSLFAAGLVSVETQSASFAYVDAVGAAAKAGVISPAFQVQPDPA